MNMQELEAIFWGDRREQPASVRLARVVEAIRNDMRSKGCYAQGDRDLTIFNNDDYFRDLLGQPEPPPPVFTPVEIPRERASIGIDPNKYCQWDPVKDSDRLWFAWCRTATGMREFQIAPRKCSHCNLPVKTMETAP